MRYFIQIVCIVLIICHFSLSHAAIPVEERQALIDLYNSTDGDNWTNNDGWLGEPGTECSWIGIACDIEKKHVSELLFPKSLKGHRNNNLTGGIPKSIQNLKELTKIDFSDNKISSLPLEIGRLGNLSIINLSLNQLTTIPPEIGTLYKLTELNVGYNNIKLIPPELGNLSNLTFLGLGGNNLKSIPPEIGNLINLKSCSLSYNKLNEIPPEVFNISNLEYLNMSVNQITTIPPEIDRLSNLNRLSLDHNNILSIPPEIANLTNLKWFFIGHNNLTILPPEIGNLYSLIGLYIDSNKFSTIPSEIGNLSNLKFLRLYDNSLTIIPPEIGMLTNLESLNMSVNKLTSLPSEIGMLTNLKDIYFLGNNIISLPPEITNLYKLRPDNEYLCSYNALEISNSEISEFLDSKQKDWKKTQTETPKQLTVSSILDSSIVLKWSAIDYTQHEGKYEIHFSKSNNNSYTLCGFTDSKTINHMKITGLASNTNYFFKVRSVTYPHTVTVPCNLNRVFVKHRTNNTYSRFSNEITVTTLPEVSIDTAYNFLFANTSIVMPITITVNNTDGINIQETIISANKSTIIKKNIDTVLHKIYCQIIPASSTGIETISAEYKDRIVGSKQISIIERKVNHLKLIPKNVFQELKIPGEKIKIQTQDANGFPISVDKNIDIKIESTAKTDGEFCIKQGTNWHWYETSMLIVLPIGKDTVEFTYNANIPGNFTIYAMEKSNQGIKDASLNIKIIDQPIATLQNPSTITNTTNFQFYVHGDYVSAYQYQLNQNHWQPEKSITEPIILTGLHDGTHTLSIIGKNELETWQAKSSATVFTWTVKTKVNPPENLYLPQEFDTGIYSNDLVTKENNLTIKGRCESDTTIQMYYNNHLINALDIKHQEYEFTANFVIPEGTHRISAIQTDAASNRSELSEGLTITVDQTPPEIYISTESGSYQKSLSINLSSNDPTSRLYYSMFKFFFLDRIKA
jgi:Leucine-rich repeat (LRR) protein